MEVVEVHTIFDRLDAVLVGAAITHAAFHATASEPEAEAGGVVVASVLFLHVRGAAKFAAPHHEGVLKQAALFEVGE